MDRGQSEVERDGNAIIMWAMAWKVPKTFFADLDG